jgi:hypothetical protein
MLVTAAAAAASHGQRTHSLDLLLKIHTLVEVRTVKTQQRIQ